VSAGGVARTIGYDGQACIQPNASEQLLGGAAIGHDALIGTTATAERTPGPRFVRQGAESADVLARRCTLTGGGYLFAPGRAALRAFAL
jgi:hypothetical protein